MNKEIKRSLNLFTKFIRAEASLISALASLDVLDGKLTASQFGVLEALLHKGNLTSNELSSKILKTKGNLTMVIDNLVKKGFVERQPCSFDRRKVFISLTTEGKDLIEDVFPRHARGIYNCLKVLSPEEQKTLGVLCKKLGTGL
ncbi:MAG: MarR family transcriptional regulator [Spirochaetia bacterium]|jgi:MarR family 2-MHQ and catechol resistance regulon transcriptional repressor|nr:MarR family transcriptional regulator [Spirochaetia bacterium]